MDWNDLKHFLAVARAGSLAAAARELSTEHTTVARRLAALEATLGTTLFLRTPRGLVPTDAARRLLPEAEVIARTFDGIAARVAGGDESLDGAVRVSTSEGFSAFLVGALAPLRERHPGLLVELIATNRAADLARGDADVAIRLMATSDPTLLVKKAGEVGWSLYASRRYLDAHGPAAPGALERHAIVAYDAAMDQIPGARWLAEHAARSTIAFRGNGVLSVVQAIASGLGVSCVPCFLASERSELVRLTPEILASRAVYVVMHPNAAAVKRVRVVADTVASAIQQSAAWLEGRV